MTAKNPKNSELEHAAKMLAFIYETGFVSRKRLLGYSFLRGFVSGIGGFIGATLGISLLLWLASIFLDVPLLGSIIEAIRDSVQ